MISGENIGSRPQNNAWKLDRSIKLALFGSSWVVQPRIQDWLLLNPHYMNFSIIVWLPYVFFNSCSPYCVGTQKETPIEQFVRARIPDQLVSHCWSSHPFVVCTVFVIVWLLSTLYIFLFLEYKLFKIKRKQSFWAKNLVTILVLLALSLCSSVAVQ